METLVAITVYRSGKTVTVYLNGHRIVGDQMPPDELVLETYIKLKDLKASLAEYLEE